MLEESENRRNLTHLSVLCSWKQLSSKMEELVSDNAEIRKGREKVTKTELEEPQRVINEDDCRQVKKDEECTRRSEQVNNVGCRLAFFSACR